MNASSFRMADIYPNAGRNTAETANQGTATREAMTNSGPNVMGVANSPSAAPLQGNPAGIVIALLIVLVALRFFRSRAGDSNEGITPTFYNIMVITLSAILGSILLKTLVVKALPSNNALRAVVLAG